MHKSRPKLPKIWKVWEIILELLCQLVEVNAWDILNTFCGVFEPSGLMNATDKTLHKKAASRCQQIEERTQSTVFTDLV